MSSFPFPVSLEGGKAAVVSGFAFFTEETSRKLVRLLMEAYAIAALSPP
ncbi:MAG: hypothetical protein LBH03_00840 [Holophagales bacterium]|nr:hypothetical protein [Holophagales bacterium]